MDEFNIEKAMLGVDEGQYETQCEAVKKHPDRFFASYDCNPNNGMDEVRKIRRLKEEYDIKSVNAFPSGLCPQVSLSDKKWYPIFVTCIDLDIPFCPCVGVPGPRIPMEPQKVEHLDEICWFFPELKVVMKHGAEPWTDLAWKLMLKYENLYYMTSASHRSTTRKTSLTSLTRAVLTRLCMRVISPWDSRWSVSLVTCPMCRLRMKSGRSFA